MWLPFSLLNALFESVSNALGKRATQTVEELPIVWSSRFFSLCILFPFALLTQSFTLPNTTFWIALVMGAILNTFTAILFIKAIKNSPLSLVLPIATFTPVFLLVTSPLIVKESPPLLGVAGVLLIFIGSYILNISKRIHGAFEPIRVLFRERGSRLMLIVTFIWSITANIDKIAVKNSNPILYSLLETFTILLFLTVILTIQKTSFTKAFRNSKILALKGIAGGLATVFQMTALSLTLVPYAISVKRMSIIFGIFWGKLFFRETNIRERLLGATVMIVGVILIALS